MVAALALPRSAPAAPAQLAAPGERIFQVQEVISAASLPAAMVASPSGQYLYVGEGGVVAVLEPDGLGGMSKELKSFPLSSLAVVPMAMALDPEAELEGEYQWAANDLIYVAAGREGLWVVHADPRPGYPNPAVRVDASPAGNTSDQLGSHWASALDFATIGGTEYLLVVFAAADDSYLRLYELAGLRALAATGDETGSEIAPERNVALHQITGLQITPWYSYAFGLAVDHEGAPQDSADVYVAHGAHGLLRVRLEPIGSDPEMYPLARVKLGPRFGEGTVYADDTQVDGQGKHLYAFDPGGSQPAYDPRIYDDVEYWDGSMNPPVLTRRHPPIFTDVAYHDGYLYALVETAGWMRFDLSEAWGQAMRIDHHEGWQNRVEIKTGQTVREILLSLLDLSVDLNPGTGPPEEPRTWGRRIVVSETDRGTVLAVTAHPTRIASIPGTRNEGRAHGEWPKGDSWNGFVGKHALTFLYRLGCHGSSFDAGEDNWDLWVRLGGKEVIVPTVQSGDEFCGVCTCPYGNPGGCSCVYGQPEVHFFASPRRGANLAAAFVEEELDDPDDPLQPPAVPENNSTYRVRMAWSQNPANHDPEDFAMLDVRAPTDRPGRFCRNVAVSRRDQRVVIPGTNDAGVAHKGAEWTCDDEVRTGEPPTGWEDNENLRGGIGFNGEAQWDREGTTDRGYLWTYLRAKWAIVEYSIGEDLCATDEDDAVAPQREHLVFWEPPPPDRFDFPGRIFLAMGGAWPEYDAHYQSQTGVPSQATLVFATRAVTDWGVVVMRRDLLLERMHLPGVEVGEKIDPSTIDEAIVGTLVTAPELAGVPSVAVESQNDKFISKNDLGGSMANMYPRLFKLTHPTAQPEVRWMLAIPADAISVHPDDPFMTENNYQVPLPYSQYHGHGKVRIFDITDPSGFTPEGTIDGNIEEPPSKDIPAWTLIGPSPGKFWDVRVQEFAGKTWMFVMDFTGEVLVYDMSDFLAMPTGGLAPECDPPDITECFPPFETREVAADISDHFRSDLLGLVVDHVEWVDEQEVPQEALYVYLGATRAGLQVLRFEPDNPPGSRLEPVATVRLPGESEGLWIRELDGTRQLVVANTYGGIRILGYAPEEE